MNDIDAITQELDRRGFVDAIPEHIKCHEVYLAGCECNMPPDRYKNCTECGSSFSQIHNPLD